MGQLLKVLVASVMVFSLSMAEGFSDGKFYLGAQAGVTISAVDATAIDSDSMLDIKSDSGKTGFIYGLNG
jgi:hypothetical protein